MAQAMVKATALVAAEKKASRLKDTAQMKFAVAAQLYCRLRERDTARLGTCFHSWWTITAAATLISAVQGLNRAREAKEGAAAHVAREALAADPNPNPNSNSNPNPNWRRC